MTAPVYHHLNGTQALAMLDELTDLYDEIHSESPEEDDHEMYSREQFISRTTHQAPQPGFELVTVRVDEHLAGYSFGFQFAAGRWWADATEPSSDILQATKLAVIELDVLREYRGQGWGRTLLDRLLANRPEGYATLAVVRDSTAQAMYERWGWYKVGAFTDDGPAMDAMVIALNPEPNWANELPH